MGAGRVLRIVHPEPRQYAGDPALVQRVQVDHTRLGLLLGGNAAHAEHQARAFRSVADHRQHWLDVPDALALEPEEGVHREIQRRAASGAFGAVELGRRKHTARVRGAGGLRLGQKLHCLEVRRSRKLLGDDRLRVGEDGPGLARRLDRGGNAPRIRHRGGVAANRRVGGLRGGLRVRRHGSNRLVGFARVYTDFAAVSAKLSASWAGFERAPLHRANRRVRWVAVAKRSAKRPTRTLSH